MEEADDREFDIFVGVDVFGRGCFGGGGLNTCSVRHPLLKFNYKQDKQP